MMCRASLSSAAIDVPWASHSNMLGCIDLNRVAQSRLSSTTAETGEKKIKSIN
jgi:hypothetical protein